MDSPWSGAPGRGPSFRPPDDGWTERQALGWLVIIIGWPLFTYPAVWLVGFLCGAVGYRPAETSTLFERGWNAAEGVVRRRRR